MSGDRVKMLLRPEEAETIRHARRLADQCPGCGTATHIGPRPDCDDPEGCGYKPVNQRPWRDSDGYNGR